MYNLSLSLFPCIPSGLRVSVVTYVCMCSINIGPPPGELWLTCREEEAEGEVGVHSQVSCLLVKINSGQHQSHYTHPLQPPALLVQ